MATVTSVGETGFADWVTTTVSVRPEPVIATIAERMFCDVFSFAAVTVTSAESEPLTGLIVSQDAVSVILQLILEKMLNN